MADRVGNLAIIISGDAKQLMQVMSGVEAHVAASQARMDAKMRKSAGGGALGGSASYLGGAAKAFAAAYLGKEFLEVGRNAIGLSRDLEVAEAQLKTLTGSAENAKTVMGELKTFAAASPFSVEELSGVARKLMGGGMAQGESLAVTKRLAAVSAGTGGDINSLGRAYSQVQAMGRFSTEEFNQFSDADFPVKEFADTAKKSMGEFREAMQQGIVPVSVMEDTFKRLTEGSGKFATALSDMANTATGRAKAEKAAQDAYLAERGARLEEMGASGRQIGNWWERVAVDAQVFGAAVIQGIGDKFKGGWDSPAAGTRIDWRLNPESSPEGIARMKAEHERIAAERRELEATAEDRLGAQADRLAEAALKLERESYRSGEMDFEKFKNDQERRIKAMANNDGGLSALDKFRELQAAGLGSSVGAATLIQEMRQTIAERNRVKLPSAMAFGSSEAASALNAAIAAGMGNHANEVPDILNRMEKIESDARDKLKDIQKTLEKLQPVQAAKF